MNWQERINLEPDLANIEQWPHIDITRLTEKKRKDFIRNRMMVADVLKLECKTEIVAKKYGTTKSKLSKLLNRCLGGAPEDQAILTEGLIPYYRLNEGKRKSPLPCLNEDSGNNYAFNGVLDKNPKVKKLLDDAILAEVNDTRRKQNLQPKWVHALFLSALENENWPQTSYPFNTVSLGYESARKYYLNKRDEYLFIKRTHDQPKRKISSTEMKYGFLEEVQIDEQRYDLWSSAHIELDGLLEPIPLSRVSLVLARDVGTSVLLGYYLALTSHPTRDDVLSCLQGIRRKWEPMELKTPGLEYPPEAGFPSGDIPEVRNICFGEVKLDNAFCHIARVVREYVTKKEFATFNLGVPRSPRSRNWIEHAFKIASQYSHRFASTTGSNVLAPNRQSEKNSKKPPLVSLRTLEECLDIALASYNAKPQGHLGGNSPLDLVRFQMRTAFPPTRPGFHHENITNTEQTSHVFVRWDKWSKTTPHVNFLKVKYKGASLSEKLVNEKIRIQYDRNDIRELKAFTLTGEYIGVLVCSKSWRRFSHSFKTRKLINKHVNTYSLTNRDPFTGYFTHLIKHKNTPTLALELIRVYRECQPDRSQFTFETPQTRKSKSDNDFSNDIENRNLDDTEDEFPDWDPDV